ncbi:MAG: PIN domain-containing protein [Alphaproteobacteria bacterium]|nr:PIN domain-containing protein [Alphaproteobacteria bacterium]
MNGFIDTNILIYAFGDDPKADCAGKLISAGNRIGVQSLNEFANVLRRKFKLAWPALNEALMLLHAQHEVPVPLTLAVHLEGMRIAERYQLPIYDAMLLAAAISAGCTIFYSEDLSDGMVVDNGLTIRNPFA